jgi:F-type H+-transporting ATPase subunit delta
MIDDEIRKNYAHALLNVAGESGDIEKVGTEIHSFSVLHSGDDKVRRLLGAPRIQNVAKRGMVEEIGEILGLSRLSRNFIKLLVDKKRIRYIGQISTEYKRIADERAGRQTAYVTTAVPLSKAQLARLKTTLERMSGKKVRMEVKEDGAILGGIVARVGDKLYEGSVKGELQAIGNSLMEG